MTVTITLTADATTGAGVNFNAGYKAFFAGFSPFELPLFLNPDGSNETTQIMHLDTPVAGAEAQTRAVLLEGDDFLYTFSNHTVSGTIGTIRLVRLGDAYNQATGDLVIHGGLVTTAQEYITFSDLDITNAAGVRGDVHAIVAGLMGGGPSGTKVDAAPITAEVSGQAQNLVGSTGADRYVGTRFGDTVSGMGGNDTLTGGAGADAIDGGAGADVLTGSKGRDTFVFKSVAEANGDRITDFTPTAREHIDLKALDANVNVAGNQDFDFIEATRFHKVAGELRMVVGDDKITLQGDVNGDGTADFRIVLNGHFDLTDSAFIL